MIADYNAGQYSLLRRIDDGDAARPPIADIGALAIAGDNAIIRILADLDLGDDFVRIEVYHGDFLGKVLRCIESLPIRRDCDSGWECEFASAFTADIIARLIIERVVFRRAEHEL